MIPTGIGKLDEILGGGIRCSIITDIFGASGTGKTQLALQVMANALSCGAKVFYQDTTGSFRPERLIEILKERGIDPKVLDRITVGRATNTREQINGISAIRSNEFTLVIIDNVTDLFSFEYSREEQMLEKTTQFAKYMKELAATAAEKKIPIVIVNMVRKIDQTERENLDSVISIFTHIKIRLEKKQAGYEGQAFLNAKQASFSYQIKKSGLVDAS
jgi:DNA repair protein RAD51